MGDSAGANAVLNLTQQLLPIPQQQLPPLVLISPWADPFADTSSIPARADILNSRWLDASRQSYFGASVGSRDDVGLLFDSAGQRLSKAELARKAAKLCKASGVSCLVVAAAYDEVTELYEACEDEGLRFAALLFSSSDSEATTAQSRMPSALLVRRSQTKDADLAACATKRFGLLESQVLLLGGGRVPGSVSIPASKSFRLDRALCALHRWASLSSPEVARQAVDERAIGLASPLYAPALASMPRSLILYGQSELFEEQGRALAAALGSEVYVGPGDIHAFLIHHTHPLRLAFGRRLFELFRSREQIRVFRETGCDSIQCSEGLSRVVSFLTQGNQQQLKLVPSSVKPFGKE